MLHVNAELLTIGSELTSGVTVNTNAAYLARRLAEVGVSCRRQVAVSDERAALKQALLEALGRCDLLMTTGGLGPTFDDITMDVIAEAVGRPLELSPSVAAAIRRFYFLHHRRLHLRALRQAYVPRGGRPLPNPLGSAPGLWLALPGGAPQAKPVVRSPEQAAGSLGGESKDQTLIALPGVPAEMRAIMEAHVLPRLKRLNRSRVIESRVLKTIGLVELSIEARLRRMRIPPTVEVGLYPNLRMVDIRLTATGLSRHGARGALLRLERQLQPALGAHVDGPDGEMLEGVVGELLSAHHLTVAVAESCTGGLLCDRLTSISGSSRYVRGGVIAYHNDLKTAPLGVPAALLARVGAVSAPIAGRMAEGVRRLAHAKIGLSVTGIAGPTGGSRTKPVGLVYFGLADERGTLTQRAQFIGDRAAIKHQAAQTAIDWLRRHLLSTVYNRWSTESKTK